MKFDFCIGNPPYQSETSESVSATNGQAPRKNIFHYFQIEADKIAAQGSVLIYPGGRWMHQSGKGLKQFGKEQINDMKLSAIEFYPNASEVFGAAAELADGVTIVSKKAEKSTPGFNYAYVVGSSRETVFADNPGDDLIPLNPNDILICKKIKRFVESHRIGYMHNSILPRSLFGIESDFVHKNSDLVIPLSEMHDINPEKQVKLLTNDKAGKAGRAKWFVAPRDVVQQGVAYIDEWQVVVSSANAGGQKRDNQLEIIDNFSAFGRSRVALKSFATKKEAQNFYRFMQSYLVRFAFLMTDEALTSLGKMVPDFNDYSDSNTFLDYTEDIDEQLYEMFELSSQEVSYIKERIHNLRRKEMA